MYLLHFVPRFFGLMVMSGYDTKCAVNENASIFDCTQEFLVANPKQWILSWFVMSNLSSICLCFICGAHKQLEIRQTCCTKAFCVMMAQFFLTFTSFLVPIYNTKSEDMPLFFAMLAWWTSTVWQIVYLNNFAAVTYPRDELQCPSCNENS